jgi:hypothetical protein
MTAPRSGGRFAAFIAGPSTAAAVTVLAVTVLAVRVLFIEMTLGTRTGAAICQTTGLPSVEDP